MTTAKKLRRWALRLIPPIILILTLAAVTAPAPATAAPRHIPTRAEAYHCMDIAADRWLSFLPSELIAREGAGVNSASMTPDRRQDRYYGIVWIQYSIAGARYNGWRWMRAWTEEGHIGCTWRDAPVHIGPGPSPFNDASLG